jgi:linoleoyl-CoA desaturase
MPGLRSELRTMRFARPSLFRRVLVQQVSQRLTAGGLNRRRQLYAKTVLVAIWFLLSYLGLMFVAGDWWVTLPFMVSLVLAMAGLAFNVLHDAGHGAYAPRPSVNRCMAMTLDLLGGSSFIWKWKHNVLHHTYPNVLGIDADVDLWPFVRMSEALPRYRVHRYQHWYIWGLYALLPLQWYVSDARFLVTGRLGSRTFPRPRGEELALFIAGKLMFATWAIVLPFWIHSSGHVIVVWLACSFALGLVLSIPFQVAHCVVDVQAIGPSRGDEPEWAIHQVATTANFAMSNRAMTWYLGGLNFQIEHHLFPSVPHVHYRDLSPIVRAACKDFGVRYVAFETLGAALKSHVDWLRRLGAPESRSAIKPAR